jgi:transposase
VGLDNASVHHSEYVVHAIESAGAKVIYTAPYSPDLNPIELMFGQYKAALKRHTFLPWDEAHLVGQTRQCKELLSKV